MPEATNREKAKRRMQQHRRRIRKTQALQSRQTAAMMDELIEQLDTLTARVEVLEAARSRRRAVMQTPLASEGQSERNAT
jgi:uncharacterized Zn finger protein (UPF0148 family)